MSAICTNQHIDPLHIDIKQVYGDSNCGPILWVIRFAESELRTLVGTELISNRTLGNLGIKSDMLYRSRFLGSLSPNRVFKKGFQKGSLERLPFLGSLLNTLS